MAELRPRAGSAYRVMALAIGVTTIAVTGCGGGDSGPAPLNLIVVSADTLNRSALRVYAAEAQELPRLDRFAETSVVFHDAHTTAPWTLPAHVSLFSGLYSGHHGITRLEQRWTGAWPTLPTLLNDAGYRTVAFTDGALLAPEYGHATGFQRYDQTVLDPEFPAGLTLPRDGAPSHASGANLFDRAVAFLTQQRRQDPPFFLFLHTFAVHDYFYQFGDLVPPLPPDQRRGSFIECLVGEQACSEQQWDHLRLRYDAGVRVFDEGFGRLLDAVAAAGLDDSTAILLLSDHGEGLAPERGRIHHGGRLDEDQIRIPLLLRVPGHRGSVERPVSLVDALPTLMDLVGVSGPPPSELDGVSLVGEFDSEAGAPSGQGRAIYAAEYAYDWVDGTREYLPSDAPLHLAVIRDGLWYVTHPDGEGLFAMADDPLQETNLAPDHPALPELRALAEVAAAWEGPAADPVPVDEKLLEHLRSLGYIR